MKRERGGLARASLPSQGSQGQTRGPNLRRDGQHAAHRKAGFPMSSTGSAAGTKTSHRARGARSGRSDPAGSPACEESPRPPRDKFEIFVHPHEDTYVGKIWHPFSRREKALKDLDGARIVQFISECMPPRPRPPTDHPEPPVQPISREGVVKELEIRQGEHRDSAPRIALRPRVPFSVTVRITLGSPPGDRIPFNVPDYTVRLVTRRADAAGKTQESLVTGTLIPGQSEYESCLEMPALPPGRYILDAYARVPYASIAECEQSELEVG